VVLTFSLSVLFFFVLLFLELELVYRFMKPIFGVDVAIRFFGFFGLGFWVYGSGFEKVR